MCIFMLSQGPLNAVDVLLPLANQMLGLVMSRSMFGILLSEPLASVSNSTEICTEQPTSPVANDVA